MQRLYFYCCTCGKKLLFPTRDMDCPTCKDKFIMGTRYSKCNYPGCHELTANRKYPLCLNHYIKVNQQNEAEWNKYLLNIQRKEN